ncbi:hypothetical protein BD324DRAFT_274629 [Kockovaella imperatae]|uniref:Uncharacterized protein n=1 Tax=Kockovaella imperatae TaxID=4999 RepID=A0A1Y1U7J6_9TREE|nr:hypothetical protein BD324DRAFT_274629 [Kockovaella imperatae]ORX33477.1 hypothetical protein BD324DRAFT_274629 [Kockovaella imperatae]
MTGSMAYSSFPPSASIDRYDAYDVGDITLQSTTSNIDDEVYRYSAEFDRQQYFESMLKSPSGFAGLGVSIPGIPRSGLYAQDGLWDEDDGISDSTTLRPVSGSTVGTGQTARHSSKASPSTMNASASTKSRDRSGTASSAVQPITLESRESKSWSWNRKSATPATPIISEVPSSPAISQTPESKRGRVHSLKSQRSKSRLRGKGRKGELSVDVGNDPDESVSNKS